MNSNQAMNDKLVFSKKFWLVNLIAWIIYIALGSFYQTMQGNIIWSTLIYYTYLGISFYSAFFNYLYFIRRKRFLLSLLLLVMTFGVCVLLDYIDNEYIFPLSELYAEHYMEADYNAIILYVLILFLQHSIAGMGFGLMREKQLQAEQRQKQAEERQQIAERLVSVEKEKHILESSFLRSQFHPHFIFNVINTMYGLARKKSDNLPVTIQKFSHIMRYSFDNKKQVIPVSDELNNIRNYLALMQDQYSKPLQYQIISTGDQSTQVVPFVLITFVENAIKHGDMFDPSNPLRIAIHSTSEQFRMQISNPIDTLAENHGKDSGLENGHTESDPTQPGNTQAGHTQAGHTQGDYLDKGYKISTGIGLQNAQRRLQLYYRQRHTLEIDKSPAFFNVSLQIENPSLIDVL